ncbi:MAG TPA: hypothetical protein VLJ37_12025 [bacterium]|nr:hypothetical protein [bacterium]
MIVSFPLGASVFIPMSLAYARNLAYEAAVFCLNRSNAPDFENRLERACGNILPPPFYAKVLEQLVTGYGIAYPERISPGLVRERLEEIMWDHPHPYHSKTEPIDPDFGDWRIEWGSSLTMASEISTKDKALRLLAKTLYRQLRANGYEPKELVTLSTELLNLVNSEIKEGGGK